ncbi:MAG: hypothetical protein ACE5NA_11450 [Nitrospiraceae bacterium]
MTKYEALQNILAKRERGRMLPSVLLIVSIGLVGLIGPVAAETPPPIEEEDPCQLSDYDHLERPDPKGTPTRVSVGIYVLDIEKVDDTTQSFSTDFQLQVMWKDPRLANPAIEHDVGSCQHEWSEVWNPGIELVDRRGLERQSEDVVEVDSKGLVTYEQRFFGEIAIPMDLSKFPFDRQSLPISVMAHGFGNSEIMFESDDDKMGRAESFSINDWAIDDGATRFSDFYYEPARRDFPRFDFILQATRHAEYYVWQVLVIVAIFVCMTWAVFWLDPSELGSQIGLTLTATLILVVYMNRLASDLPPVPYLTSVDKFIIGALLFAFLAFVEVVVSCTLFKKGRADLAYRLDRQSRVIFPTAFLIFLIFQFAV